ncbi:GntR family transcriptional regulator [Candidatus Bipolaricaulota bacterium]|nr:GntR family transcriptional regulator [Candidatus Bipolaricaulota bacterium]
MLISIDEGSRQPIYVQIVRQIKEQILVGELRHGDELPSVRDLGDSLGISLHTVRSAYQTLAEQGLLRVRLGKKTRIAAPPTTSVVPDLVDEYSLRVREWIVDGLLLGWSADRLRLILDQEMNALSERGATSTSLRDGKERA